MFEFLKYRKNIEHTKGFLNAIRKLRKKNLPTPLTDNFEAELRSRKQHPSKTWYINQGEHWDGWLRNYDGVGFYNRKNWNRTSEYVYNHIMCQPMLIWLAETLDIESKIIESAITEALKSNKYQEQCRIIREHIKWSDIKSKLNELI